MCFVFIMLRINQKDSPYKRIGHDKEQYIQYQVHVSPLIATARVIGRHITAASGQLTVRPHIEHVNQSARQGSPRDTHQDIARIMHP